MTALIEKTFQAVGSEEAVAHRGTVLFRLKGTFSATVNLWRRPSGASVEELLGEFSTGTVPPQLIEEIEDNVTYRVEVAAYTSGTIFARLAH